MSKQKTVTQRKADTKKALLKKKKARLVKKLQLKKAKVKKIKQAKLKKAKLAKIKAAKVAKAKKASKAVKKSGKRDSKSKTVKKVKVGSLLTRKDEKYMLEKSISTITVLIDNEKFMVSKQHMVPKTAKILRDGQGQVTGMKAIASG